MYFLIELTWTGQLAADAYNVRHEEMKKDLTRLFLTISTALNVVFALLGWYLYVRTAHEPSQFRFFWSALVSHTLFAALCVFLLVDARNSKARLFWAVMLIATILRAMINLGSFSHLPRHGDLLMLIMTAARAVFTTAFLIGHRKAAYSLFGKRTEAYLRKHSASDA